MELLQAADMDANTKFHLANILIHSDLSLLEPYMDALAQSEDLNKRIQTRKSLPNLQCVTTGDRADFLKAYFILALSYNDGFH